jgi:hypothetical protein
MLKKILNIIKEYLYGLLVDLVELYNVCNYREDLLVERCKQKRIFKILRVFVEYFMGIFEIIFAIIIYLIKLFSRIVAFIMHRPIFEHSLYADLRGVWLYKLAPYLDNYYLVSRPAKNREFGISDEKIRKDILFYKGLRTGDAQVYCKFFFYSLVYCFILWCGTIGIMRAPDFFYYYITLNDYGKFHEDYFYYLTVVKHPEVIADNNLVDAVGRSVYATLTSSSQELEAVKQACKTVRYGGEVSGEMEFKMKQINDEIFRILKPKREWISVLDYSKLDHLDAVNEYLRTPDELAAFNPIEEDYEYIRTPEEVFYYKMFFLIPSVLLYFIVLRCVFILIAIFFT